MVEEDCDATPHVPMAEHGSLRSGLFRNPTQAIPLRSPSRLFRFDNALQQLRPAGVRHTLGGSQQQGLAVPGLSQSCATSPQRQRLGFRTPFVGRPTSPRIGMTPKTVVVLHPTKTEGNLNTQFRGTPALPPPTENWSAVPDRSATVPQGGLREGNATTESAKITRMEEEILRLKESQRATDQELSRYVDKVKWLVDLVKVDRQWMNNDPSQQQKADETYDTPLAKVAPPCDSIAAVKLPSDLAEAAEYVKTALVKLERLTQMACNALDRTSDLVSECTIGGGSEATRLHSLEPAEGCAPISQLASDHGGHPDSMSEPALAPPPTAPMVVYFAEGQIATLDSAAAAAASKEAHAVAGMPDGDCRVSVVGGDGRNVAGWSWKAMIATTGTASPQRGGSRQSPR